MLGTPLLTEQPLADKKVVQRSGAFTDGNVYYMPSADGIAANGKCWSIAANAVGNIAACADAIAEARTELKISDQIVMGNLIDTFRQQAYFE
ncbi:hypothetical protein D3C78_1807870 [compost metagenome]